MSGTAQPDARFLGILISLGTKPYIPVAVCLIAILAGMLHMMPHWRAQSQVQPGWTFTGNTSGSPDAMQYRVWPRQSLDTGILVTNKFSPEETVPYIPVLFYYVVGRISLWTHASPEVVYAYAGAVFAFLLTILIFLLVRHFLVAPSQTWWVFLAIMLGGGLGSHLRLIYRFLGPIRDTFVLQRTLVEGMSRSLFFDNYRSHYVFVTLFDTHFLLIWLLTTAAVFSLYLALRRNSYLRLGLMAILYALVTLIHVYEGVTLLVVTLSVVYLSRHKGLAARAGLAIMAVGTASVAACVGWQLTLFKSSGLSVPHWRAWDVPVSMVLLAYPLAWGLIIWGVADYWRQGDTKRSFLLGWALGCTILTLSAPFYPFPDRGSMTLQIPVYVVAGAIYFSRFGRVSLRAALVAILLLGATPARTLTVWWRVAAFDPGNQAMFLNSEHLEFVDLLKQRASENDLLMVDKSTPDWLTDDRWLAPEYPGKVYPGHFFLSDDYERKRAGVNRFFGMTQEENIAYLEQRAVQLLHAPPKDASEIRLFPSTPDGQAAYLDSIGIRFLYVPQRRDPDRFQNVPGLSLLKASSIGSLFEFTAPDSEVSQARGQPPSQSTTADDPVNQHR